MVWPFGLYSLWSQGLGLAAEHGSFFRWPKSARGGIDGDGGDVVKDR